MNSAEHAVVEARWEAILRHYQEGLDAQRRMLEQIRENTGHDTIDLSAAAFEPPSALPPMPSSLRGRVEALRVETDEVMALAREVMAGLRPPSRSTLLRAAPSATASSRMDTRL